MRILEFLHLLKARGGDLTKVRISVPHWGGSWCNGVYLHTLHTKSLRVSSGRKSPDILLNTDHPVYDLEIQSLYRMFGKDFFPSKRSLVEKPNTYTVLSMGNPVVVPQNSE